MTPVATCLIASFGFFPRIHHQETGISSSSGSQFVLRHAEGRVRIQCQQHQHRKKSSLGSTCKTAFRISSWCVLGSLIPTEPFWVNNHCRPLFSGSFQQDNARCRKATAKSNSWTWQWIHCTPEATFQCWCVFVTLLNLCHREGTAILRSTYEVIWPLVIGKCYDFPSVMVQRQNNQNRLEGAGPRPYF